MTSRRGLRGACRPQRQVAAKTSVCFLLCRAVTALPPRLCGLGVVLSLGSVLSRPRSSALFSGTPISSSCISRRSHF